ncbi:MAG TPA: VOC family protein [Burkholderiales bacterium]|nr:VOC family protein [Burkholderiales bacterium]
MLTLRGIDHVVLRVRDIDAMRRFYCDVLGAEHVAWRPELRLSHLRAGSSMIDLVLADGPREGENMDHFCLRVEPFDAQAIMAHLQRHGVAPGEIRPRFGAEGNGPSIYLTDPEGNTVELKGPSDGKPPPQS